MKRLKLIKRTRLKRKYLTLITIILTISSIQFIKLINNRISWIKKEIEQCDNSTGYTCSIYELNQHFIKNTDYN